MIVYILLLWILSQLSAPTWCYLLLGLGIGRKLIVWTIKFIAD